MPLPASLQSLSRTVLPLLHKASNGARVVSDVKKIVRTDRWNSFDHFHETTNTLAAAYEQAGAAASVYSVPTGGPVGTGRWLIHEAADIHGATLDIVSPVRKRLLDWARNPWHVIQWSASTPREGVTGDLVIIDTEEDLAAQKSGSLNGKIVLTRLNVWAKRPELAAKGAACVISDAGIKDLPGATPWTKFGWGAVPAGSAAARLAGLALSANDGAALRKLKARHGKLMLRATLSIDHHIGSHDVVSGVIPGRDDSQSEVWAVAHSSEPGALDNASGVAVCIEIARILNALITSGKMKPPRRGIRLLHGYECYGFFHYLEHQKRFQTPLAGVCIDTLGAIPIGCGRRLKWHSTVPSSADFVDRVGAAILRAALKSSATGYALLEKPFVSTEDTLLGDPKFGFPCPWITNHPFKGYHSSADTLELLHPAGLQTCAAAMAAYLYFLADAGTPEALELAAWQTQWTASRIAQLKREKAAPVALLWEREKHSVNLERLKRWQWGGEPAAVSTAFSHYRQSVAPITPAAITKDSGHAFDSRIPRRILPLAPMPDDTPAEAARVLETIPKAALFLADGLRSIIEIRERFNVSSGATIPVESFADWFVALEKIGFVELLAPASQIGRGQLVRDLKKLGVKPGMDLIVHSALSKLGPVAGGVETVLDALLEVLGMSGTLLAPSFNHFEAALFNPVTTPTTNGAIADALWRRPSAARSLHPSHSVCAVGPKAAAFCADHLANGIWAHNSPIGRLIHGGGYILSLGVTHEASTAYHVAEISLKSPCLDPFGSTDRIVAADGSVKAVPGLAWRADECPVNPSTLNETLAARGLMRSGKVGRADALLTKALDVWSIRREHIQNVCPRCAIRPARRNVQV